MPKKVEVLFKNPAGSRSVSGKSTKGERKMAKGKTARPSEAYCLRCRETVTIKDAKKVDMNNPKRQVFAMKGKCPHCGTGVFRILPSA